MTKRVLSHLALGGLVALGLSAMACSEGGGGPGDTPNNAPNNAPNNTPNNDPNNDPNNVAVGLTFFEDVQPLMIEHCGSCHFEGGAAPFALTTFEEVSALSGAVASAIEEGRMPPWQADDGCRTFKGERRMTEVEKSVVMGWIGAGMPKGDPSDAPRIEAPSLNLDGASLVTRAADPYLPNDARPDDYHCLVMEAGFDEEKYLRAYQILPDVVPIVHHVVLYLIPPQGVESMKQADDASPEPGYTCFGGSGHSGQPMGVWVPGAVPQRFPDDSAFVIPPGSKIVAQMHYNTLVEDAQLDRTELHLEFTPTPPGFRITMPILAGALDIEAGDPASVQDLSFVNTSGADRKIVSVMPHMHVLGTSIDLRRVRDGEETCVVRVNDWDFNWQQFFDLKTEEFVDLKRGDELKWTCVYDNSASNQAVINGEQVEPRDVHFGEGTLDEMCVHILAIAEPFQARVGDGGDTCGGFGTCYEGCEPGDPECFLTCGALSGGGCSNCMLTGLNTCGQRLCRSALSPVVGCLQSCDAELGDCLFNECRPQLDAFWGCIEPPLLEGQCNAEFSMCELEF